MHEHLVELETALDKAVKEADNAALTVAYDNFKKGIYISIEMLAKQSQELRKTYNELEESVKFLKPM